MTQILAGTDLQIYLGEDTRGTGLGWGHKGDSTQQLNIRYVKFEGSVGNLSGDFEKPLECLSLEFRLP